MTALAQWLEESHKAPPMLEEIWKMATERLMIPGIVKNGLVVPQSDTPLPDGAHVDIILGPAEMSPALQAEVAQWEKASDEAWSMIDQWEADEP